MAQDKTITINFVPKGDDKLIKAFQGLSAGQKRFNKDVQKGSKQLGIFDTQSKRNAKSLSSMGNAFSVVRSKLLLFNFAVGTLGVKALAAFAKEAAKVESMGRAFNTLSGGVSNANIAIGKLQVATNNTMSEFDLFQQANNAMILGVSKNSDEMAEMFDIAQRLGRALGRDTASSVESLITGIGRQSRLMLDNIGIIVKADEAYEKYAEKLGTTADKLSDADKKTAFLEATMESARTKVASLGAEVFSSQDSFDAFSSTVSDLRVLVGEKLKGAFTGAMNAFVDFVNVNKDADVESALASRSVDVLNLSIKRLKNELEPLEKLLEGNFGPETFVPTGTEERVRVIKEQIGDLEVELSSVEASLFTMTHAFIEASNVMGTFAKNEAALETLGLIRSEVDFLSKSSLVEFKENYSSVFDTINNSTGEFYANLAMLSADNLSREQISINMQEARMIESLKNIDESSMSFEEKKKQRKIIIDEFDKKRDASKIKDFASNLKQTEGIMKAFGATEKEIAIGKATIDGIVAIQKAWTSAPFPANLPAVAITTANTVANVQAIKAQQYETGGLVGGRRHSQGGTMIEAEQGEFVMSRNAVNAVGIEAMNRINQGGGAGSVVINVSGNVMSQDYVEGELADQLKTAIRRGADIGVS
tara:strand:+ start:1891 stop:3834 length:1944 start_codon:yes stop_codon:yes gene_type:complete